jgi:hypothetical protein
MKEMFEFEFSFCARIKNKSSLVWEKKKWEKKKWEKKKWEKKKWEKFELDFYFYVRTHDMCAFPYTCFSQNIHIDITIFKNMD